MNTLNRLNNAQRAKLIFELLPADIPEYIEFTKALSARVTADPEGLRKKWNNCLLTVDSWVRLAKIVAESIDKHGVKLSKSSRLFSFVLFDGYVALFSVHCLQQFVLTTELKEPRLKTAVELFFTL
ncbi:hypothetical protein [Niabella beijingensis]|uniref:hypothetical protein n=1 Tax=Niabella beijingensis TaxID=2872700 RepID=UPI001CBC6285|nr:hypothetical protein [Niabella beijingensis]MBZ4187663.1 hypothetical protein [Niabella beijingensis]